VTRILLVGANGQVGTELQRTLAPLGEITAVDRDTCDLTRPDEVRATVRATAPKVIVNVAAHTAVDQAESEADLSFALNADGPGLLAEEARRCGAALIHYSTDYVFDGAKPSPYVEDDPTGPLSVYGRSKLAGEQAIAASGAPHLVLRTSWVYALRGKNFLVTMMRLAREKPELRVVADQRGVPNWAATLADATADVVRKASAAGGPHRVLAERGGVYHLSCGGQTTWHGFAAALIDRLADAGVVPRVPVVPITTAEFPTAAKRPANSVLDAARIRQDWGLSLPDWSAALQRCLEEFDRLKVQAARPGAH
jgi:dTDP-4-dehydrorhamnose reductase